MSVTEKERDDEELRRLLQRQIEEKDPEFLERIERLIRENATLLDRLKRDGD